MKFTSALVAALVSASPAKISPSVCSPVPFDGVTDVTITNDGIKVSITGTVSKEIKGPILVQFTEPSLASPVVSEITVEGPIKAGLQTITVPAPMLDQFMIGVAGQIFGYCGLEFDESE